jgi:hypothetical protein
LLLRLLLLLLLHLKQHFMVCVEFDGSQPVLPLSWVAQWRLQEPDAYSSSSSNGRKVIG